MKKVILMMLGVIFIWQYSFAQAVYYPGQIWVIVHDEGIIPNEGETSTNLAFQQVLNDFNITTITQPMSFASTPELQRLYQLNTNLSEDLLFAELEKVNKANEVFLSIEKCPKPISLYDPSDYLWTLTTNSPPGNWLWYLESIQAPLAWDITKGDPNVKVAIVDSGIDPNHPDLIGKISPNYDFFTGNPFPTVANQNSYSHGTSVSTLLAAETTDQGQQANGQLASIGYNTEIMYANGSLTQSLYASTTLGADVLSISWYFGCSPSTSSLLAEQEILDNGTCIIRAAGNGNIHCQGGKLYPFSGLEDDRTIVITSTGRDDKHLATDLPGYGSNSHYPEVDLAAPGYTLFCGKSTVKNDGSAESYPYGTAGGTSQSTPLVAGTAALMYAVNPCLTPSLVSDILKNTTDPIVDEYAYPGLVGTGRLNSYKAVKAANTTHSTVLDLYIKDRWNDFGKELFPYDGNQVRDESPDIWVRNQPDGFTNETHENPEYSASGPVYVYVRVRNKSCVTSIGDEQLELYWSQASSATSWPQNWDGSSPSVGDVIGTQTISVLEPGETTILEFQWNIINPYMSGNWATCLMARIAATTNDPITIYPNRADNDVYQNNNVAIHNVNIVNVIPGISGPPGILNHSDEVFYPHGSFMYIGNPIGISQTYNFTFHNAEGKTLNTDADVKMIFDDEGWAMMSSYFEENNEDFEVLAPRVVKINNELSSLNNVVFPANTRLPVYFGFNFHAENAALVKDYKFRVNQYLSSDLSYLGSELYEVSKGSRNSFFAHAGDDVEIDLGESTTLVAATIDEAVIYTWYNSSGEKIGSGQNITVNPYDNQRYKLEVTAMADGAVDYDHVNVDVLRDKITNISPNPASSIVRIEYLLDNPISASLIINNITGTVSQNIPISNGSGYIDIDITNFQTGTYSVILTSNGVGVHSKTLIVN